MNPRDVLPPDGMTGKILVIDDEESICSMVAGILKDDGHRVSIATSGTTGLKLLAQEQPDVCFLDQRYYDEWTCQY